MILYNITMQVSWGIHDAWIKWLKEEQLPALLASGCFTKAQFVKLIEVNEEDAATYAVQLYSDDTHLFNKFREDYLEEFQKKETILWGEQVFSFASVMEVIN